jgi:hypothetical protein
VTVGILAGIILLALGFIIYTLFFATSQGRPARQTQAWFTTDDGATWFPDDAQKVPPFQTSDGKTAVRAYVYQCPGSAPFVSHLERYTPEAKKLAEQLYKTARMPDDGSVLATVQRGLQVKDPGQGKWMAAIDPSSNMIVFPFCPDGSSEGAEEVHP